MKAARYNPASKQVELRDIPVPEIENDLILVKTIGSGLCHSDMLVIHGKAPFSDNQAITIGHEAVGEVVEIGSDVHDIFKVGDKVGFLNSLRSCWECEGCARHFAFCERGNFVMQGFACDGFMQEYILVDPKAAFMLPNDVDPVTLAPICCAGITSYNGIKAAQLQRGGWIGIIGCGGVGQLGLRYAAAMGLNVVAVDIDDKALEMARQAGVDHLFNSRSDPIVVEKIKKISPDGRGLDSVVVFTAVNAGYIIGQKLVKTGGRLVCVGVPEGEITLSSHEVPLERFTVHGASTHATRQTLSECATFTRDHCIKSPCKLFKIEQIEEMIAMMEGGSLCGMRLVVDFTGQS